MSWYATHHRTKVELIESLTAPYSERHLDGSTTSRTTLARTLFGSTLWVIHEISRDGVTSQAIVAYAHLASNDGLWGYTPVSEEMGPVELGCPVRFFDLVPEPPNEWAREFRARTCAYARRTQSSQEAYRSLSAGDRLTIDGVTYTVTSAQRTKPSWRSKQSVYRVFAHDEAGERTYQLRAADVERATLELDTVGDRTHPGARP